MDIVIEKPARLTGYALHRMVEQHQNGQPALWADEGRSLRIRPRNAEPPRYESGKLLGFTVTACVALKKNHKHRYLPLADWRDGQSLGHSAVAGAFQAAERSGRRPGLPCLDSDCDQYRRSARVLLLTLHH